MTTINLATVTREELKKDIADAVMNGDAIAAKIRFSFLGEIIDKEGFESVDEINEYYMVRTVISEM
jgi:hypothetical protein